MNKIMDGWYAGGDSYKPLHISSDMQHMASLSFVGDTVVVRPLRGTRVELVHDNDGGITFRIVPFSDDPSPADRSFRESEGS